MPELIGITGGIGSGKSRVCRFLADLCGWPLLNLDQICRELLLPEMLGWLALRQALGRGFFTAAGELNRPKLREAIFADAALRQQVDSLLHPLAKQAMLQQAAQQITPLVLAEIPLLFEAGWQDSVSRIVVVYADEAVRLRRIMERDQVSEEQARRAIAAQMPLEDKAQLADYLVDNSGDWEETCGQLRQVAESMTPC
ncbi:dephospho-CoA kinase [Candidatus Electronema sp. JM]|uniref:dephospho-CoA kinase n=1 Tax=Candidatus Electronema sp. JM TaxID=3401571 RepID=UPI003AA9AF34